MFLATFMFGAIIGASIGFLACGILSASKEADSVEEAAKLFNVSVGSLQRARVVLATDAE
jgi:hypothetical protein